MRLPIHLAVRGRRSASALSRRHVNAIGSTLESTQASPESPVDQRMASAHPPDGPRPVNLLSRWLLFILLPTAAFSMCTIFPKSQDWETFQYDGEIIFTLEYPATWTAIRDRNTVTFTPRDAERVRIEIVIYDPTETPPLAVHVTYDTLRVVETPHGLVPVMNRDPAAATERYIAMIRLNSHVAEFRLHAEYDYDAVFDHMLGSMKRND